MTRIQKKLSCATLIAGLLFLFTAPHAHATDPGIQMLPPLDFNGATCDTSTAGLLWWQGKTAGQPIRCIPGVSGDQTGKLTITNTVTVNNSLIVNNNSLFANSGVVTNDLRLFLNGGATTDVTNTILSLNGLSCPANTAVTTNPAMPGTYMCVAVTNIVGVGKTVMPSCPAGTEIYFDGASFGCRPMLVSCPSGQVMFFDGANVSCAAIPFPAMPVVPTVQPGCNDNFHALRSDANGNLICSQTSCYYDGNYLLYFPYYVAGTLPANLVTPQWVPLYMSVSRGTSDGGQEGLKCTDAINNVLTPWGIAGPGPSGSGQE